MSDLGYHQTYLIEEFAEDYLHKHLARRDLVKRVLLITGSVPLTASVLFSLGCSGGGSDTKPAATASSGVAAPPTAVPTPVGPGVPENDPAITAAAVAFPGPASEIKAYLARPKDRTGVPGVVVIHENRGLVDHTKDIARRYAKEGFAALAVDLISRAGGTGPDANANSGTLGAGANPPSNYTSDLVAGVNYLKSQPFIKAGALGVTGFCFGGGFCFETAVASPDIKAAVPYYGSVSPALMENLPKTNAAIFIVYAGNDTRITSQEADVVAKLKGAGKTVEAKVYPNVDHGFFNDTGTRYSKEAADTAWKDTLAWFRKYLV
jgi:carboxymethylenebutenolidase